MSSGDHRQFEAIDADAAAKLLALAAVRRAIAAPKILDTTHDIPYLAGYSRTGRRLYLDRHLPRKMFIVAKLRLKKGTELANVALDLHDMRGPLLMHEQAEKALIDHAGLDYQRAHMIARDHVEHTLVRLLGIHPDDYEAALRPYIRSADHESIKKPPRALDLRPYLDEHDKHHLRELEGDRP